MPTDSSLAVPCHFHAIVAVSYTITTAVLITQTCPSLVNNPVSVTVLGGCPVVDVDHVPALPGPPTGASGNVVVEPPCPCPVSTELPPPLPFVPGDWFPPMLIVVIETEEDDEDEETAATRATANDWDVYWLTPFDPIICDTWIA